MQKGNGLNKKNHHKEINTRLKTWKTKERNNFFSTLKDKRKNGGVKDGGRESKETTHLIDV